MKDFYQDKRILVTGAAGTVGKEIVRQMNSFRPRELRLMDNNETGIFFLAEEYNDQEVQCFLGDIRDEDKIEKLIKDIDIVIHCAAFKHVMLSEYNPFDVVQTNVIGVENIIRAATACAVKKVLFTSSDKAVNPTNVMGSSKLMGEKLITAANTAKNRGDTIFSSTRFGNVLGSRGSVVPVFARQIREGGPVTVTDKQMTRFIMTVKEAARLVLRSVIVSKGGEVLVAKMRVVRIPELAEVMIEMLAEKYGHRARDIKIKEVGAKPGEKLYEELLSEDEVNRSVELRDMFVITPAFMSLYDSITYEYPDTVSEKVYKRYISSEERPLTRSELKQYLTENKLLENIDGMWRYGKQPAPAQIEKF